ncbi:hypothetical protein Pan181_14700 [Aeoliella mucimassa]|uniref:Protein SirB1 N-terminal domain-containing protein n=2 Tax=Aeoliella mucimassa TaxID=2527972 RepID=A0A518AKN7_9BACT|nr:hypothetical protein Pan181_14700 [Aeoliella mucimassa]
MRQFHEMPADEYARLDIGEVNLACADKLCGSEELSISQYLAVLDEWAAMVARSTARNRQQFDRRPSEFRHSEAFYRMVALATVLQRDIGIEYATDSLEQSFDCTDSRLHFIHGIIEGRGGTCATLPVLFVAIGRRLGYPLKLVSAAHHLFVRWDDLCSGERFNIEATAKGLISYPDEHYYSWPAPVVMQHVRDGWLLKSMTPTEELSVFYETRARCCLDWMQFRAAYELSEFAATQLTAGNPYRWGFHAIATALYRSEVGLAKYGFKHTGQGVVIENGVERPMKPWEKWAIREGEKELKRIEQLHVTRRQQGRAHIRNRRIIQLAAQPHAAVEAYFEQEVAG